MNHNMSADIRNWGTIPTMKNRVTKLLSAGVALCAVFTVQCHHADAGGLSAGPV